MVLYIINHKCNTVDGYENINSFTNCKDDPEWFVETNDKDKKYCRHIGESASCYDRDAVGREGWERCLKTCGNCVNTKVSKAPMGTLAGFSGDPYEDFGVVLHTDKDREWVGSTGKKGGTDDKEEDIDDLQERLDSVEDIFDMITGDIKSCNTTSKQCKEHYFNGCDGQCLKCPEDRKPSKKKRSYIEQTEDGSIKFPAKSMSCSSIMKDDKFKNVSIQGKTDSGDCGKVKTQVNCKNPCTWYPSKGGMCYLKTDKTKKDGLTYDLEYKGCFTDDPSFDKREMEAFNWDNISKITIANRIPTPKKCPTSASKYCVQVDGSPVEKKNMCATYCTAKGVDAEYMGIQYGNQCFCSKKQPSSIENDAINKCGLGGVNCFKGGKANLEKCSKHNAVFHIIGNRADDGKTHTSLKKKCKQYLLFNKLIDDDDDDDEDYIKEENKNKLTLYDMCPLQCGEDTCHKK